MKSEKEDEYIEGTVLRIMNIFRQDKKEERTVFVIKDYETLDIITNVFISLSIETRHADVEFIIPENKEYNKMIEFMTKAEKYGFHIFLTSNRNIKHSNSMDDYDSYCDIRIFLNSSQENIENLLKSYDTGIKKNRIVKKDGQTLILVRGKIPIYDDAIEFKK